MLEGLFGSRSLLLVLRQELCDEILTLVGDLAPHCILEREFAKLNFLHDFLVRCAIERWDAR